MKKRKKVEAWFVPGKNGETGRLSFDPPIARHAHRCVRLVEHSPTAERVLKAAIRWREIVDLNHAHPIEAELAATIEAHLKSESLKGRT